MHHDHDQSVSPDLASPALAEAAPAPQSWGEKHRDGVFFFLRNWGVNYFINFIGSAALNYAFDTSRWGESLQKWKKEVSTKHKETIRPAITEYVIDYLTRTQLLLLGGHALQPFMKWMKDHEHKLQYGLGHRLDQLQEVLGQGDDASKRALTEYEQVKEIQHHTREVTKEDAPMLAKHHLNSQGQFIEQKQPWSIIIKGRLLGMMTSTVSGIAMGLSSAMLPKGFRYQDDYEIPFGEWTAKHVITKTPGLKQLFHTKPELMGRYFFNDMFLTLAAKTAYDISERKEEEKLAIKRGVPETVVKQAKYLDRVDEREPEPAQLAAR